jgi:hypothetical protein
MDDSWNIDNEFPRLKKLREARAARILRQQQSLVEPQKRSCHDSMKTINFLPESSPRSSNKHSNTNATTTTNTTSPTSIAIDVSRNAASSTLLRNKYNDVCLCVSQLDQDIQNLLERGSHLAEQTVLDAEATHYSTYGMTFTSMIDSIAKSINVTGTNNSSIEKLKEKSGDIGSSCDSNSIDDCAGSVGEIESSNIDTGVAKTKKSVINVEYCSMREKELQTKLSVWTLRKYLGHWRKLNRLRRSIRKRFAQRQQLGQSMLQTLLSEDSLNNLWLTIHETIGNGSFHPEQIFQRDGKHRMAKEYQNHRILRICFGRWVIRICFSLKRSTEYQKTKM